MDLGIKGKVAIIGGSSKGLGKACALALAAEGVNVVLCARNSDTLINTKKEVEALGVEVLAIEADMSVADDNIRIVENTIAKFGGIDILVNNSGGPKPGTFRDVTLSDMDEAYNSVLKYNVRMINLCLPYMEQSGWGRIVNITSVSVKEPIEDIVLSNIFRSAVVSYAKTISREIIKKGVTINNVCPGYFNTDRVKQLLKANPNADQTSSFPHKRYMEPYELGDLVAYLCSKQAKSINGTTIQIDGGLIKGIL